MPYTLRNPGGHAQIFGPGLEGPMPDDGIAALQRQGECDTYTCNHCQHLVHVGPHTDVCMCKQCMRYICLRCDAKLNAGGGCTPWEEQLERSARKEELYQAIRG